MCQEVSWPLDTKIFCSFRWLLFWKGKEGNAFADRNYKLCKLSSALFIKTLVNRLLFQMWHISMLKMTLLLVDPPCLYSCLGSTHELTSPPRICCRLQVPLDPLLRIFPRIALPTTSWFSHCPWRSSPNFIANYPEALIISQNHAIDTSATRFEHPWKPLAAASISWCLCRTERLGIFPDLI